VTVHHNKSNSMLYNVQHIQAIFVCMYIHVQPLIYFRRFIGCRRTPEAMPVPRECRYRPQLVPTGMSQPPGGSHPENTDTAMDAKYAAKTHRSQHQQRAGTRSRFKGNN
jgi:hypothetical protein